MKATFNVPGGIKTLTQSPEISKYYNESATVYNDTFEVNDELPIGIRYKGLTVNVMNEEFWYKDGIEDEDLVAKGGGASFIEKTIDEVNNLISSNSLVAGSTYKISGVHKSLYDDGTNSGTTVHLQAMNSSQLSESGQGIFWNPKYDKNTPGYGIYSPYSTYTATELNVFRYLQTFYGSSGSGSFFLYLQESTGILYVANYQSNYISKILPDGSNTNITIPAFGSEALAMDSLGNLWVTSSNDGKVMKITPDGVASVVGNFLTSKPKSIVVDSNDNVFVTRTSLGSFGISKITPGGVVTNFITFAEYPAKLIIDSSDNLYVSKTDAGIISKITPSGVSSLFGNPPTTGYSEIFLDSNGDIIGSHAFDRKIAKIYANGDPSTVLVENYTCMYLDADDNMYGSDYSSQGVYKIEPNLTITFMVAYSGLQSMVMNSDGDFLVTKYQTGFGNVSKLYDVNTPIPFQFNENVTADNGATGSIVGGIESGLFIETYGDWTTATKIKGNWSGAEAEISDVVLKRYNIGDKVIWGGYCWENNDGNVGRIEDVLTLSSGWTKLTYSETDYNRVIDYIEYDVVKDNIIRRREIIGNNDVYYSDSTLPYNGFERSPISVFMFGNEWIYSYDDNTGDEVNLGLSNNTVSNSYIETINFAGSVMLNNKFGKDSMLYDNNIFYGDTRISGNTLESTYFYQNIFISGNYYNNTAIDNCNFGLNLLRDSSIGNNKLSTNSDISQNRIANSSSVENNTLNNSTITGNTSIGAIANNILISSNINSNKIDSNSSNITGNDLLTSSINGNILSSVTTISYNRLMENCGIESNSVTDYNGSIDKNNLYNSSYIRSNIITGSYINRNTIECFSEIDNNTFNSTNIENNKLYHFTKIDNNKIPVGSGNCVISLNSLTDTSEISNNSFGLNINVKNNTLTIGSNISDNIFNSDSYVNRNDLYASAIVNNDISSSVYLSYNSFKNASVTDHITSDSLQSITRTEFITTNLNMSNYDFSTGSTTLFEYFDKIVYLRPDGTIKLRYFNNDDNLVISDIVN